MGLACFYRMRLRVKMNRLVLSEDAKAGISTRPTSSKNNWFVSFKKQVKPIFIAFIIPLSLNLFSPLAAQAVETVIPVIYLNEEQKGEYFIKMTEDRDFLIKAEDLKEIGLLDPKGKAVKIEGVSYLSLKSMAGITFSFDENKQALKIQALPNLLARKIMDFSPVKSKTVDYSKDNSVFINYGLNYNAGNGLKFNSFTATHEIGIRVGDLLFLSDSVISVGDTETKFNRLMSSITYDRRDRMDTFVLGDFSAYSGNLGSCLTLGGLSYSKNYSSDPHFIKRPVQNYQGVVTTPSEVDVYLNGVRIRSERVSSGGFDLRNIQGYSGNQDLEIVVKDAFGREKHISNPFYVFDPILAKGLHDYSYNLGFQRKNIGSDTDQYGDLTFMGFHRYGLTNNLTLGLRGEAADGLYNLSPQLSLATNYGAFELTMAGSRDKEEKTGLAGSAIYIYQGKRFNVRLGTTSYSEDYNNISNASTSNTSTSNTSTSITNSSSISILANPRLTIEGGIGYGMKSFGSLSLNYTKTTTYKNEERQLTSLMYTKGFGKNCSLSLSLNQTIESSSEKNSNILEFFVGLTFYPWKDTIMTNTGMSGDNPQGHFQIQKNAPVGEGYGYRAAVDMTQEKDGLQTSFSPFFQYNGKYGIYSTELSLANGGADINQTYQFTASGAIVYVGKTVHFTRPVNDSFALINVGQVPGVRVYHNNQELGKTDRSGNIVIPDFHSYDENQVSINDRDIPLKYALTSVNRYISPPIRSGTLVKFEAKKVQAFTGLLKVVQNGKKLPVEYQTITMKFNGKVITFQTGRDGEFFIEDAVPGTFKAFFKYAGKAYTFDINIPKSDEIIIEAGEIHVQVQP